MWYGSGQVGLKKVSKTDRTTQNAKYLGFQVANIIILIFVLQYDKRWPGSNLSTIVFTNLSLEYRAHLFKSVEEETNDYLPVELQSFI